jgi:hypothetical protein
MKCGDRSTSDSKIWALGAETNLCDWKDKQTLKRTLGERVFFLPRCPGVQDRGCHWRERNRVENRSNGAQRRVSSQA